MNISQILTKLKSLVYSKSEADTLLSSKASSSHKHTKSEITDFPTIPTKTSQLTNDSGFLTSHQSLSNYSTLANTVKSLSISGKTITVTPGSGNAYTLTTQDTNTTYSNFVKSGSGAAAGLVPAPSTTAGTTKYLREDGTWQVPPDHTYTVNNATLTIQKNGSNVATFTANASSNVTANITVPTKTSQLTNDSGYITSTVTGLTLKVTDTNSSTQRTNPVIQGNSSNVDYGLNSCFGTCSNTIVGAGEGKDSLLSALAGNSDETLYLISDGNIYFHPNAQTYTNRKTIILNTSGALTGLSGVSTSNVTVTNNSSNGVLFGSYRVYVG